MSDDPEKKKRRPESEPDPNASEPQEEEPKEEKFYDAAFSIEAMQDEPYEDGFTWRAVVGALFIAFVMLPGVIFMGLMIGQDLGTAADWVTIILFVELARRSFISLRKQELYILKYTVSNLTHMMGGVMLAGGVFAHIVFNRYLRNSEAFASFGIAHKVPDWFAPLGDAAYTPFTNSVWLPVIAVLVASMLLSKLTQLSLGYMAYKMTSDVEQLPFPLAPIQAEGSIALAESSQDKRKTGFRQYCFSIGIMLGAAYSVFYVAIPVLSQAFIGKPITLIPIPFLDLTQTFENILPAATIGISLNLGLLFTGFVLPWRIAVGMFAASLIFQIFLNPILYHYGILTHWAPGKDAIETHVANTLDIYLSVGIGTALAIAVLGVWGIGKAFQKNMRAKRTGERTEVDFRRFFQRDVGRGDPPLWAAFIVWFLTSTAYVVLCDYLINSASEPGQHFSVWWLISFAFFWTPANTYINARLSGIAGQNTGIPFLSEGAIFLSGYRGVAVWFAPLPLQNYGQMADFLRETQLTRTKFTSILKAELLIFPLMLVASFIFWSYITSLGPIPSDNYPFVQKFWPQFAQLKALWAASMQEGQSLLFEAIKPQVIFGSLGTVLALFAGFTQLGISTQYIYGGIGTINGYPHLAITIFVGACIGRFILRKKFGTERWTNYAPILAVGFGAGLGLVGMFAIAINFLWVSIGTGY